MSHYIITYYIMYHQIILTLYHVMSYYILSCHITYYYVIFCDCVGDAIPKKSSFCLSWERTVRFIFKNSFLTDWKKDRSFVIATRTGPGSKRSGSQWGFNAVPRVSRGPDGRYGRVIEMMKIKNKWYNVYIC